MEKTPMRKLHLSLAFLELLSMLELRADQDAEDQVSWQARSWTLQTGLIRVWFLGVCLQFQ